MTVMLSLKLQKTDRSFDCASTIARLREAFPEIIVLEGDQLKLRADRAEKMDLSGGSEYRRRIVDTLRKNAELYGPATAFVIPTSSGIPINGTLRPRDLTFTCSILPLKEWPLVMEFCKRSRGRLELGES